eukprot:2053380-Rhodomonas_salina.1
MQTATAPVQFVPGTRASVFDFAAQAPPRPRPRGARIASGPSLRVISDPSPTPASRALTVSVLKPHWALTDMYTSGAH